MTSSPETPHAQELRDRGRSAASRVATVAALVGAFLVLATTVVYGGLSALTFGAWALIPYGILYLAGRFVRNPWILGGAGAAAITAEVGIRAAVFLFPAGSTAAVVLVFSPMLVALLLPIGGVVGFLFGWLWRRGGVAIKTGVVLVSTLVLGLMLLGLARPDLFPTAVLKRRAALSRIGEPGVVAGGDDFETVLVSETSAWHSTGELDGVPGEEIAVVDHRGFELFEPVSLESRGVAEFDWKEDSGWTSFSRLARLDGHLVIVQAGGGFSETEVHDLEGNLLWSYRPDPDLPPTALWPADLDRDGETELYASDHQATVRLDAAGREIWRRLTRLASLVALAPRTEEASAWIVAMEYGSLIRIWDEKGDSLAEIPIAEALAVLGVVDWPRERTLVVAGETMRGIGLDSSTLFEIPWVDFSPTQAVAVRFAPDGPPLLVLSAAAPPGVERWRLLILSTEDETVYDEILDQPFGLLTARAADGSEVLLLSGRGLRALRLRRR